MICRIFEMCIEFVDNPDGISEVSKTCSMCSNIDSEKCIAQTPIGTELTNSIYSWYLSETIHIPKDHNFDLPVKIGGLKYAIKLIHPVYTNLWLSYHYTSEDKFFGIIQDSKITKVKSMETLNKHIRDKNDYDGRDILLSDICPEDCII